MKQEGLPPTGYILIFGKRGEDTNKRSTKIKTESRHI
jgi:hypothetical protein